MHLIRAATLVTPDPEAAAAAYAQWMDYTVVERGDVPADLAASWGAPASAGRAYTVCRPKSGRDVYLRFVQGETPQDYKPLRTYGWAAIEICVQDVLAVNARMEASPFEIIGPPAPLDGLPTIFPMQVKGPDQEIVFLTEILGDVPEYALPRAESLIDRLFILVLACSDIDASNRWLETALKLDAGRAIELAYGVLSDAFGLPADHPHKIGTLTHGHDVFLEVDQYPANATARPQHPGELPPGIAMATLKHPDFAALEGPWITPPARREGVIYGGARAGVMAGPDGVLVEVVEIASL
jgi:catechol 2,3-dioxygenase-like lactoylglutathione lyase family enzyme